ncbi:transcriptional regulator [Candidatus Peregrinibacteria bacterium]|nr:MAG: transcriptional regulator [Candidatus Peregrinibacteria bacterium]
MNQVFKALSDPSRRKILELLKAESLTVTDILKHFSFTNASLSHHLDILKRADLICRERKGQFIHYSINTTVFEDVMGKVLNIFKK